MRMNAARRLAAVLGAVAVCVSCLTGTAWAGEWRPRVSAGVDSYVHTYHLADDDTTETVSEYAATAESLGRSARDAPHAWSLRAGFTGGSELLRQRLDAGWRWRADTGDPLLRVDVDWYGRQYHRGSDYGLTSDNHEGTTEVRGYPWKTERLRLDLRMRGRYLAYRTPSSLEQSYREHGGAAFLSSRDPLETAWRVGLRATRRIYPDSTEIGRDAVAIEGDLDRMTGDRFLWLYHRSERRWTERADVRPWAWSHWTELRATWPAGPGKVVTNAGSEVWRYDREDATWFDSWRLDGELGYGWGDPLGAAWQTLVTIERLAAGDSPETYTQIGLRGSVESYAGPVSGILALEYGRRWYAGTADDGLDDVDDLGSYDDTDLLDLDIALAYTDFSYLEIWLMATWELSPSLALELMANYQPEQHTEQDDDTAIGFGSARLVWRP